MDKTQEESQSLVQFVKKSFDKSDEHMSQEFERLHKLYQLYRAVPDTAHYSIATRSQYVVPLIYKTVETVLPRIISVLFSASPPIQSRWRIHPGTPDAELKLRALDQWFEYQFDQKRLYWVVQAWIKESLIYGQSYLKVGWKKKLRTEKTTDYYADEEGLIKERVFDKTTTVEDTLDVQNVDIFDLYFSPEAHFPFPFETSKYVIHKSRMRKSQVLQRRDDGVYLKFEDSELSASSDQDSTMDKKQTDLARNTGDAPDNDDPMVDIYEYWEDERVITTANHSVLLRNEANPFGLPGKARRKPFVACVDNLVYGMLFQIGEAEPLEHTQIEISTLRRQRTDNNSLIINKMWLYNKDAEVDLEAFMLARPGGAIGARPGDGPLSNAVMPIEQHDISGASDQELSYLDKDGQEISGLLDYAVGSAPERRETATTVQLLQAAANARFDIKVRNYAQSMQELGYMMFERAKQLLVKKLPLRIPVMSPMGAQYVEVSRDTLPEYDAIDLVVPGSPGLLLKDARQQKLLQYFQSLLNVSPPAAVNMLMIALKEAEIDGIEPVLLQLQQSIPMLQQQQQLQMLQQQAETQAQMAPPISPDKPEMPERPEGAEQATQVNRSPVVLPFPQGSR